VRPPRAVGWGAWEGWHAPHEVRFDWVLMKMRMLGLRLCAAVDDLPPPGLAASAPTGHRAAVLDMAALARLRELDPQGVNHLLERVFAAFETSLARLMPQMHEALRCGDRTALRQVAHTLKSSSASVGALRLSQLCAEVEAMVRQERGDGLDQGIAAIAAEVEIVLDALKQTLNAASRT
jgi:HPt (histidine-containing phosphotransfer) domain-containing protein